MLFGIHIWRYLVYGLIAGLVIAAFAWLKSEYYFTGSAPDFFLTLVAVFFAAGGWFIHFYVRKGSSSEHDPASAPDDLTNLLSKRELEVFYQLLGNDSNKIIADKLNIEMSTLKTHINNIYKKTGAGSRKELGLKYAPPSRE